MQEPQWNSPEQSSASASPANRKPRRRRRVLIGLGAVLGLVFAGIIGLLLLDDDPTGETDQQAADRVLPTQADVERVTGYRSTSSGEIPLTDPDEFRGTDDCRTAWQPLRAAVIGSAVVKDTEYDLDPTQHRQLQVGVAVFDNAATARHAVNVVDQAVSRCHQMWVREQDEANDWKVQPGAGSWYLIPVPAREGNWYCAIGFRSEGRFVYRADECGTGPNRVPALLDELSRKANVN